MAKLIALVRSLARDEKGQDLIEYALLATMIAIFCIAALVNASSEVNTMWGEIATDIANAVP
jgi:Flp pilus assembly pilin Flp